MYREQANWQWAKNYGNTGVSDKNVCVKDITYELDANTGRKYVMLYWY